MKRNPIANRAISALNAIQPSPETDANAKIQLNTDAVSFYLFGNITDNVSLSDILSLPFPD